MQVELQFSNNGKIATIIHPNGLILAEFIVNGPFQRNAQSISKGFDDRFCGIINGIGDDEYIDRKNVSIKKVKQQ